MRPGRTDTEYDVPTDVEGTGDRATTLVGNVTRMWEQLTGAHRETCVGFHDLFSQSFMREHTQYESFDEFTTESHWEIETETDLDTIPLDEFDRYVAETTRFSSWDAMATTAAENDLLDHYAGVSIDLERSDE